MATQWKQFKLEDICRSVSSRNDLIKGKQVEKYSDGLYPAFSATGQDIWRAEFEHEGPAIIVSAVGARCGKCFKADGKWTAIANTHIIFAKENVSRDFLFYYINNEDFWEKGGVAQPFVKIRDTLRRKSMPLPVDKGGKPDLAEQRRIVAILEETEVLKKKRTEVDQKMNELIPALFVQMFGDPVRNEKGWKQFKLKELAKIKIGPFGSLLHFVDYVDDGVPLVNPTHIIDGKIHIDPKLTVTEKKVGELSAYRMLAGDVVLGRRGEMGRCAMVTEKESGFLCGTGSLFISPSKQIDQFFLYCFISSPSIKRVLERVAKGVTMKNLNSGNIEDLSIYLPPLELQNQFAEKVKEIETQKDKQKQSTIQLDGLFQSLLANAFSGKL